jgi:hypothetical protein
MCLLLPRLLALRAPAVIYRARALFMAQQSFIVKKRKSTEKVWCCISAAPAPHDTAALF